MASKNELVTTYTLEYIVDKKNAEVAMKTLRSEIKALNEKIASDPLGIRLFDQKLIDNQLKELKSKIQEIESYQQGKPTNFRLLSIKSSYNEAIKALEKNPVLDKYNADLNKSLSANNSKSDFLRQRLPEMVVEAEELRQLLHAVKQSYAELQKSGGTIPEHSIRNTKILLGNYQDLHKAILQIIKDNPQLSKAAIISAKNETISSIKKHRKSKDGPELSAYTNALGTIQQIEKELMGREAIRYFTKMESLVKAGKLPADFGHMLIGTHNEEGLSQSAKRDKTLGKLVKSIGRTDTLQNRIIDASMVFDGSDFKEIADKLKKRNRKLNKDVSKLLNIQLDYTKLTPEVKQVVGQLLNNIIKELKTQLGTALPPIKAFNELTSKGIIDTTTKENYLTAGLQKLNKERKLSLDDQEIKDIDARINNRAKKSKEEKKNKVEEKKVEDDEAKDIAKADKFARRLTRLREREQKPIVEKVVADTTEAKKAIDEIKKDNKVQLEVTTSKKDVKPDINKKDLLAYSEASKYNMATNNAIQLGHSLAAEKNWSKKKREEAINTLPIDMASAFNLLYGMANRKKTSSSLGETIGSLDSTQGMRLQSVFSFLSENFKDKLQTAFSNGLDSIKLQTSGKTKKELNSFIDGILKDTLNLRSETKIPSFKEYSNIIGVFKNVLKNPNASEEERIMATAGIKDARMQRLVNGRRSIDEILSLMERLGEVKKLNIDTKEAEKKIDNIVNKLPKIDFFSSQKTEKWKTQPVDALAQSMKNTNKFIEQGLLLPPGKSAELPVKPKIETKELEKNPIELPVIPKPSKRRRSKKPELDAETLKGVEDSVKALDGKTVHINISVGGDDRFTFLRLIQEYEFLRVNKLQKQPLIIDLRYSTKANQIIQRLRNIPTSFNMTRFNESLKEIHHQFVTQFPNPTFINAEVTARVEPFSASNVRGELSRLTKDKEVQILPYISERARMDYHKSINKILNGLDVPELKIKWPKNLIEGDGGNVQAALRNMREIVRLVLGEGDGRTSGESVNRQFRLSFSDAVKVIRDFKKQELNPLLKQLRISHDFNVSGIRNGLDKASRAIGFFNLRASRIADSINVQSVQQHLDTIYTAWDSLRGKIDKAPIKLKVDNIEIKNFKTQLKQRIGEIQIPIKIKPISDTQLFGTKKQPERGVITKFRNKLADLQKKGRFSVSLQLKEGRLLRQLNNLSTKIGETLVVPNKSRLDALDNFLTKYTTKIQDINTKTILKPKLDLKEAKEGLANFTREFATFKKENKLKIVIDRQDITKAINGLVKVHDLLKKLPSAQIKITGLGTAIKQQQRAQNQPPAPPQPPVQPPVQAAVQPFTPLRDQVKAAALAADRIWQDPNQGPNSQAFMDAKTRLRELIQEMLEFQRISGQITPKQQISRLMALANELGSTSVAYRQLKDEIRRLREEQARLDRELKPRSIPSPSAFLQDRRGKFKYSDSTANSIMTLSGMPGFLGTTAENVAYYLRFGGRASKGMGSALEAGSQLLIDLERVRGNYLNRLQELETTRRDARAAARTQAKRRTREEYDNFLVSRPNATSQERRNFLRGAIERNRAIEYERYGVSQNGAITSQLAEVQRQLVHWEGLSNFITNVGRATLVIGALVKSVDYTVSVFNFFRNGLTNLYRSIYNVLRPGIELYKQQSSAIFSFTASLMSNANYLGTPMKDLPNGRALAMGVSEDLIKRATLDAELSAFSLEELLRSLQGTLPILLNLGMSLEEAYQVNKGVAGVAKMIQLTPSQILQETRDLAQGSITSRGSQVANTLGVTNADLKKYTGDAEGLFNFLMQKFKEYSELLSQFEDTALGRWQQLQERWQTATKTIVESIAGDFKGLFEYLINLTGEYVDGEGNRLNALTGKWEDAEGNSFNQQTKQFENSFGEVVPYSQEYLDNVGKAYKFNLAEPLKDAADVLKELVLFAASLADNFKEFLLWATGSTDPLEMAKNLIELMMVGLLYSVKILTMMGVGFYKIIDTLDDIIYRVNVFTANLYKARNAIMAIVDIASILLLFTGGGVIKGLAGGAKTIGRKAAELIDPGGELARRAGVAFDFLGANKGRLAAGAGLAGSSAFIFSDDTTDEEIDEHLQRLELERLKKQQGLRYSWFPDFDVSIPGGIREAMEISEEKEKRRKEEREESNQNISPNDLKGTAKQAVDEKALKKFIQDQQKLYKSMVDSLKDVLDASLANLKEINDKNELDFKQGLKSMQDYYSEKAALDREEHKQRLQELMIQQELLLRTPFANEYEAAKEQYELSSKIRTEVKALEKSDAEVADITRLTGKQTEIQSNVTSKMKETANYFKHITEMANKQASEEEKLLGKQEKTFSGIKADLEKSFDFAKMIREEFRQTSEDLAKMRVSSIDRSDWHRDSGNLYGASWDKYSKLSYHVDDRTIDSFLAQTQKAGSKLDRETITTIANILGDLGAIDWLPEILSQIIQESNGRHFDAKGNVLTSSAGALGIMQIIPDTAKVINAQHPGYGGNLDVNNKFDNILLGILHMLDLIKQYNYNWDLALAAYNAGSGAVEEYKGIPNYGETIGYIRRIRSNKDSYFSGMGIYQYSDEDVKKLKTKAAEGNLEENTKAVEKNTKAIEKESKKEEPRKKAISVADYALNMVPNSSITSDYGYRTHPITGAYKLHKGVDIGGEFGDNITSPDSGKITRAGWFDGYGNAVEVQISNGLKVFFAHMNDIVEGIVVGATVEAGQLLGHVGSTGNSTGPHVHVEVEDANGNLLDPKTAMIDSTTPKGSYTTVHKVLEKVESSYDIQQRVITKTIEEIKEFGDILKFINSQKYDDLLKTPVGSDRGFEFQSKVWEQMIALLDKQIASKPIFFDTKELEAAKEKVERDRALIAARQSLFNQDELNMLKEMELINKRNRLLEKYNKQWDYMEKDQEINMRSAFDNVFFGTGGSFAKVLETYSKYMSDSVTNPFSPAYHINRLWQLALGYQAHGDVDKLLEIRTKILSMYDKINEQVKNYIDKISGYFSDYQTWLSGGNFTNLQKARGEREIKAREGQIQVSVYTKELDSIQKRLSYLDFHDSAMLDTLIDYQEEYNEAIKEGQTLKAQDIKTTMGQIDETLKLNKLNREQLQTQQYEINQKKILAEQQSQINDYLLRTQQVSKQALEDGLVTFLTDGVNSAESLGDALRDLAVTYLKTMQKYFAEELVTDMMIQWFPARRDEYGYGVAGKFDEYAMKAAYDKIFMDAGVNKQFPDIVDIPTDDLDQMARNYYYARYGDNEDEKRKLASFGEGEKAEKKRDEYIRKVGMHGLHVESEKFKSKQDLDSKQAAIDASSKLDTTNSLLQQIVDKLPTTEVNKDSALGKTTSTDKLNSEKITEEVNVGEGVPPAQANGGVPSVPADGIKEVDLNIDGSVQKATESVNASTAANQAVAATTQVASTNVVANTAAQNQANTNVEQLNTNLKTANDKLEKPNTDVSSGVANTSTSMIPAGTAHTGTTGYGKNFASNFMNSKVFGNVLDFANGIFGSALGQLAGVGNAVSAIINGDTKERLLGTIFIELQLIYQQLVALNANVLSAFGFSKGGIVHAAKGFTFRNTSNGLVHGPGTSTSDSIPAMLSDGEAVLNAKAVRQLGVNFINSVNNGEFSKLRVNIPHFAKGGVLGDAQQSTARGMSGFAHNIGTNISTTNQMNVALVRDEQEAYKNIGHYDVKAA